MSMLNGAIDSRIAPRETRAHVDMPKTIFKKDNDKRKYERQKGCVNYPTNHIKFDPNIAN
jgi:hypothetical protein